MRIAHLRKIRNLTQDQLAKKVNRTIDTISAVERGKSMPNFQTLGKLAEVFELEPKDLFDFSAEVVLDENTVAKKDYLVSRLDDLTEKEIEFILSILEGIKSLR